MSVRILLGDVRDKLAELADESVHCVVTSPPYFGLRDYGIGGQIGLEETPEAFVAVMVEVFREVRRVLRKDGTLWLNLGDSYAGSWGAQSRGGPPSESSTLLGNGHIGGGPKLKGLSAVQIAAHPKGTRPGSIPEGSGLKPKDLIGIPWRVAFALQADGWYLRQDIIWSKPNPMPESVTDRCTKAHEYLFLLTKSARYHYDAEAILEPASPNTHARLSQDVAEQVGNFRANGGAKTNGPMKVVGRKGKYAEPDAGDRAGSSLKEAAVLVTTHRNKRSVWEVATQPFKEAHFATFPPDLIEPCIKAGCPKDCCAKCGAPMLRQTSRGVDAMQVDGSDLDRYGDGSTGVHRKVGGQYQKWLDENPKVTTGWLPSCTCDAGLARGVCLDPFGGAGTTGLVADRLQRDAILIELNPAYLALAGDRITDDAPLFAEVVL